MRESPEDKVTEGKTGCQRRGEKLIRDSRNGWSQSLVYLHWQDALDRPKWRDTSRSSVGSILSSLYCPLQRLLENVKSYQSELYLLPIENGLMVKEGQHDFSKQLNFMFFALAIT